MVVPLGYGPKWMDGSAVSPMKMSGSVSAMSVASRRKKPSRLRGVTWPAGLGPGTQFASGGVVSTTVMTAESLPVLPDASVAVQVTGVAPSGKVEPAGGAHDGVSGPSTLSTAVAG